MKVFKYAIEISDHFTVRMPRGAKVLTVARQGATYCLWALVDPSEPQQNRHFRWAGTGHDIFESPESLVYVTTFQEAGGALVWHIFEVIDP